MNLNTLYQAHAHALYAFVYRRVGNREATEDITSEVFLRALTHLDLCRPEPSIVAWLYQVARNATADYWRAGSRTRHIALDEAWMVEQAAPTPDWERQEQTAAQANALLARLPEAHRAVLAYRLLEGLSVAETAQRLGLSPANVRVLQHRALKRAALWEDDIRRPARVGVRRSSCA